MAVDDELPHRMQSSEVLPTTTPVIQHPFVVAQLGRYRIRLPPSPDAGERGPLPSPISFLSGSRYVVVRMPFAYISLVTGSSKWAA
jgi:hypothetical protein